MRPSDPVFPSGSSDRLALAAPTGCEVAGDLRAGRAPATAPKLGAGDSRSALGVSRALGPVRSGSGHFSGRRIRLVRDAPCRGSWACDSGVIRVVPLPPVPERAGGTGRADFRKDSAAANHQGGRVFNRRPCRGRLDAWRRHRARNDHDFDLDGRLLDAPAIAWAWRSRRSRVGIVGVRDPDLSGNSANALRESASSGFGITAQSIGWRVIRRVPSADYDAQTTDSTSHPWQ